MEWLRNLAVAFLFADPSSLREASGFIVLWFLPALLSTVLLAALFNASSNILRAVILIFATFIHLAVGAASASLKMAAPQGVLIALYMLPLGLATRHAIPWLIVRQHRGVVTGVALIVLFASWASERGLEVEIATLVVPTLLQPLWVIATDLSNLGFLVILIVCNPILARIPGLALLGRHSLLIYLFHPIFYKPIFAVLALWDIPGGATQYCTVAALSVASVATVSLAAAAVVRGVPLLRSLVTPRNVQDWLPVAICRGMLLR
jgi:surface polysaccharide O-acyltransferase-like enzyme